MTVRRSPSTPNTARPSGEKPGIARPAATRSTSSVERASASARPASSRNASRERRQSPVTAPGARAAVCGEGSVTSWMVPISSTDLRTGSRVGLERLRTVRITRPCSSMIRIRTSARVSSATASWTTETISFQSTGWSLERAPAWVRVVGSGGSPRSRAASASTVTVPAALSQVHSPVARADRTSSTVGGGSPVRIDPL